MDDASNSKALIRLEVQVEGLTKEVHGLKNLLMSNTSPSAVEMNAKVAAQEKLMNTRMEGIERTLQNLVDKVDERAKIPWGQWIAFIGVLWTIGGGIGGFFLMGVNANLARIERDITALQQTVVPRAEITEKHREFDRRASDNQRRIEGLESLTRQRPQ